MRRRELGPVPPRIAIMIAVLIVQLGRVTPRTSFLGLGTVLRVDPWLTRLFCTAGVAFLISGALFVVLLSLHKFDTSASASGQWQIAAPMVIAVAVVMMARMLVAGIRRRSP
jgi:hypothetical protein